MASVTGSWGALGRSLVVLREDPGRTRRALRWIIPVGSSLIITSLVFGPGLGALGLIGAMSGNAGREEPLRRRARTLLLVGGATALNQTIGMLVSPHTWAIPPVITALTLLTVWIWHALLIGPPGPINTLFAAALGIFLGDQGYALTTVLPVTVFAAATAAVLSILVISISPFGPGRAAVAAAETAVDAYAGRQGGISAHDTNRLRSNAHLAVFHAWHVLRIGGTPRSQPRTATGRELSEHLLTVERRLVAALQEESFPTARPETLDDLDVLPLGRPSASYLLRAALQRGSRPTLLATRAALAVLLASSMMIASPVGHPYWAILSALIVLHMGASRVDLTIRAAHRVIGTTVGVLVYFGIISLGPSNWLRIGIVIVAIFAMESLVTRNYAYAVVFVTLFALLMTPTSSEAQITVLMVDRVVETVIGVGAAVLVIWLVGRHSPVLLVRSQFRRTQKAILHVLDDLAQGAGASLPGQEDRRNLVFEVERAAAILSAQRPDDPETLARWLPIQDVDARFGFDVMAACWRPTATPSPAAARAHDDLAALISGLPKVSPRAIDVEWLTARMQEIRDHFVRGIDAESHT